MKLEFGVKWRKSFMSAEYYNRGIKEIIIRYNYHQPSGNENSTTFTFNINLKYSFAKKAKSSSRKRVHYLIL